MSPVEKESQQSAAANAEKTDTETPAAISNEEADKKDAAPIESESESAETKSPGDGGGGSSSSSRRSQPLSYPPLSGTVMAGDSGRYIAVTWDLDTTGRRLLDEICQIGAFNGGSDDKTSEGETFSQYVMPYKNPNPGARRSFGIR